VDRAVNLVSAAGMRPLLVVTGPGPLWASQVPARHSVRYKPRPDLFGQFARAPRVALRRGRRSLDHLERAQPAAVAAAAEHVQSAERCTPYAPHLYRRLVRAAYPAIKAVDPTSSVLFGALAPRGENATKQNARTMPLAFVRSMGCVKVTLKRDRSGPCKGFQPLTATASPTTPTRRRARPTTRSRGSTRRRSPTCHASSARSTAPSGAAA
jgi:hypothetical protein